MDRHSGADGQERRAGEKLLTRDKDKNDDEDLSMGDIAMLSVSSPRKGSLAVHPRDAMDLTPGCSSSMGIMEYGHSSSPTSISHAFGHHYHHARKVSSPSSSILPGLHKTSSRTDKTHAPSSTTPTTHTSDTSNIVPGTGSITPSDTVDRQDKQPHSLLTASRKTFPAVTGGSQSTSTPLPTTQTVSTGQQPTPAPSSSNASPDSPPNTNHPAAPSTSSTASAPINPPPPHSELNDGRFKRYTETQGDYKPGGYARVKEGDKLNRGRYEVVKKLGVGHFSVVWLAWDREEGGYVAIKIVRSSRRYTRAALHEDKLLTVIQGPRDERKNYVVSFLNSFEERSWEGPENHVCLVFELMGMSLTDVLRKNDFDGLPIKTVKLVTKQVLTGLSYLHSLGIAHTDIKPDNILLYHSPRQMSKMLRKQLEADEIEKERLEREEALNPKPEPINWLEHKPKIPGLNPQQIRQIQLARIRSEQRKWTITPSMPLESPIPFANGKKIVKEFVLANKHLYKKYPIKSVPSIASSSHSLRNSLENDRTSASHPLTNESSLRPETMEKKEVNSTQTTPTKDLPPVTPANHPSPSPKGKLLDAANPTESPYTLPSSVQSSKSPYSSLGRLKPSNTASYKDTTSYVHVGRMLDRLSLSDFLRSQRQADELDIPSDIYNRNDGPFGLKHPRTSSNGSGGSGQGETEFDKLLRQPLEYDLVTSGMGGPSPMFIQKSPSDSGGSEIFSPASTAMTRYFPGAACGGSATDSPASMASTPITSSPEMHISRKFPSPVFPHPAAVFSTAVPIPRKQGLIRNGSTASNLTSHSFNSFSPGDSSLFQADQQHPSSAFALGRHAIQRAKSSHDLEDEQAMLSLPASPPSHPTSYISTASMSPEVAMRKGSLLAGLGRSGSDASIGGFDLSITEEVDTSSKAHGEDGNVTLIGRPPKYLPGNGSSLQGLGLNMSAGFARLNALAIPKAAPHATDSISPLVSTSPPGSMSSSMLSRTSELSSSASPPISMGSLELPHHYQPKITKLDSPARVKNDPLLNIHVKLSDLGNAIYYNELKGRGSLPENVCTRQYRPPENIIQADYNLGIDVWALGCVIYEMITGEMLFNPSQEKYRYTKEDDLLGQQIEILGPFSSEFALSGKKSLHFFNRHGQILRVRLTPWLLFDVMVKKYYMPRAKARKFCDFLLRMLEPDPSKRATVEELLQDPWLNEIEEDDDMVLYRERKNRSATPVTPANDA